MFLQILDQSDENLNTLNYYLKYANIQGDIGYPNKLTLLEKALEYKKFDVALLLVTHGEGKLLREESLIKYLIEEKDVTDYIMHTQTKIL